MYVRSLQKDFQHLLCGQNPNAKNVVTESFIEEVLPFVTKLEDCVMHNNVESIHNCCNWEVVEYKCIVF